jgi:hypothetical protein
MVRDRYNTYGGDVQILGPLRGFGPSAPRRMLDLKMPMCRSCLRFNDYPLRLVYAVPRLAEHKKGFR